MKPRNKANAEELTRTATALRAVYMSILPRLAARNPIGLGKLGYAAPSYNRACLRTQEYFQELGRELEIYWYTLMDAEQKEDGNVRRIVREYQEEAAEELAQYVETLPKPYLEVVMLKSAGLSWKKVMEQLPKRAYFSVMDDWEAALKKIWADRGDLVRRLI